MSKYDALWKYVSESGRDSFKKELTEIGYQVGKISMKEQTVEFIKE